MSQKDIKMKDLPINFTNYKKGDIITGTIVMIGKKGAVVNIGGMRDGFVPNEELDKIYKEGDAILVMVKGYLNDDNCIVLDAKNVNYALEQRDMLANIKIGTKILFPITDIENAGLRGNYYGYNVFVPYSQIREKDFENKNNLKDREIEAVVLELNSYKKSIVASNKILSEEGLVHSNIVMEKGEILKGSVLKIMDKYALVLLDNGIKAKLNIVDVSYDNIDNIANFLAEGKKYNFVVLDTNEDHSRTTVGYKQLKPNPFIKIVNEMKIGDEVQGEVAKIYPSGALIKLANGMNAFALTKDNTDKSNVATHHIFKLGDSVTGKINQIDKESLKINIIINK